MIDSSEKANLKFEQNHVKKFSFVDSEHRILKLWEKGNTFQRSLEQTREKKPFIFYDGPPFATGLPHHGHLVGTVLKDIVPRYWTMKGFYVERRFGWDCHGLPVEHEIDKKFGMSAQEAIKELGIVKYNNECRSIVSRYVSEWRKTITRIGRWVDFDNDYKTMQKSFMESVWWVFKELWDKKLIYRGTQVISFSTELGTALSNFEAGQNYQDVQDPSVTVLFKLDEEESFILAWTTTPWTLPSNIALCVGDDIDYILIQDGDKKIYLSKRAISRYEKNKNFKIIKELKGSDLKGKSYTPLFPYFEKLKEKGAFVILSDSFVTGETGTGIVHIAPGFGEDDQRVIKEAGIDIDYPCPVDNAGKFMSEVSDYEGIYVKDADKKIIQRLKGNGQLYEHSTYVHSYPFCYRSDTPLINRSIPSWYVNVEVLKEKLLKNNQQIHWVPGHIKEGRFGKWLEGARDWSISRSRAWGTPLPIWYNKDQGKYICIGSIEELKNYTGKEVDDLHREHVDELKFSIKGEKGEYQRIEDVLDCWFESGAMPYAQLHYPFENQEVFSNGFPAQFIAEGLDQTRGWFYTLTVLSTALFDKPAFKNVIVNGIVMSRDGKKKMSKRLKNYTAPDVLMEQHGADAMRLYLINSGLVKGEEMRFSDDGVKDMVRRALLPWYNAFMFFATYAKIDKWDMQKNYQESTNITDNWIHSLLQTLKKNIAQEMEGYRLYNVVPVLFSFIEDLTNWYIRLNRSRFWSDDTTGDKNAAFSTLFICLKELSMAMAPLTPFLSEYVYQELLLFDSGLKKDSESVHLCSYPEAEITKIDSSLEDGMSSIQEIILLGRQKRTSKKIKIKIPLSELVCIHKDNKFLENISILEGYIKTELNVKKIKYETAEDQYIKLQAKPNLPRLGKRFGKKLGLYISLIKNVSSEDLVRLEKGENIIIKGESFSEEDFLIYREALKRGDEEEILSGKRLTIMMNFKLDEALLQEGLAREVVNRVQKTRKENSFNVEDRIFIYYKSSPSLKQAIEAHRDYISKETLADKLLESLEEDYVNFFSIENEELFVKLVRS